jgi:hypothetical protein
MMNGVPRTRLGSGVALISSLIAFALNAPAALAGGNDQGQGVTVTGISDVAGVSPFTNADCNVATPYYTSPGGKEGEPFVAVNPAAPSNRIAVWMDAARATDDTAFTVDGGRHWTLSIPQGIDGCTGNTSHPWEASGDPSLSFGPDGVAYLSTLTWANFAEPPFENYVSVVRVQTSRDGGRNWSAPVLLGAADAVSDKPTVVADPRRAGVAYEIWRNQAFGLPVGDRGATRLYFASTHDGGRSWSPQVTIASGADSDFFGDPELSVLRDGTLVATSSLGNASGGTDQLAWRSTDGGTTWQGPVTIREASAGALANVCDQGIAGADTGAAAGQQTVEGGNTVALVTIDGASEAAGHGEILLSRSSDGGRTWQTTPVVQSSAPILLASVAAGSGGTLGLVWDQLDLSRVDCSPAIPLIPAKSLTAVATGDGSHLSAPVTLGATSWNIGSGLRGTGGFSGIFVGDYQSIAATPDGFTTATVQGTPLVAGAPPIAGATGVMVAEIDAGGENGQ